MLKKHKTMLFLGGILSVVLVIASSAMLIVSASSRIDISVDKYKTCSKNIIKENYESWLKEDLKNASSYYSSSDVDIKSKLPECLKVKPEILSTWINSQNLKSFHKTGEYMLDNRVSTNIERDVVKEVNDNIKITKEQYTTALNNYFNASFELAKKKGDSFMYSVYEDMTIDDTAMEFFKLETKLTKRQIEAWKHDHESEYDGWTSEADTQMSSKREKANKELDRLWDKKWKEEHK